MYKNKGSVKGQSMFHSNENNTRQFLESLSHDF